MLKDNFVLRESTFRNWTIPKLRVVYNK